jgi:hypothetical protein
MAEKLPNVHPGEVLLEEYLKPLGISLRRLVFAKNAAVHPFVGDDPAVLGVFFLGHRRLLRRRGIPEVLYKAQSRMDLVLGEVIHQGA